MFSLTLYTHFYLVKVRDIRYLPTIYNFIRRYFLDYQEVYDKASKQTLEKARVWAGRTNDNTSFRFPIYTLDLFYKFLNHQGFNDSDIKGITYPQYKPKEEIFKVDEKFQMRDYQLEAIKYTTDSYIRKGPSVLISMPPGSGKTVTLCKLIELFQVRTAMVIPPTYLDKWAADAKEYLNLEDDDVYKVAGSISLIKLIDQAKEKKLQAKLIIISIRTFRSFLEAYEESPLNCEEEYGCTPIEFWKLLRIGLVGGDEVHEQFHAFTRFHTCLHGPFHVGLSATMMNQDPFVEEIQKFIYPLHQRYDKIKMKRYITLVNVDYKFENPKKYKLKSSYGGGFYSHNAFESSILKHPVALRKWLEMVKHAVDTYFYHPDHQEGDKLGIYFSSLEMIDIVVAYLKRCYPGKDIRRYVGTKNDPYENIIDPEIRVTTQGSGGTGKDIKNLTTVLNFNCMESKTANVQLFGRIREIPGRNDLYFVQFSCLNIPQHLKYKQNRNRELKDKVSGITSRTYPVLM